MKQRPLDVWHIIMLIDAGTLKNVQQQNSAIATNTCALMKIIAAAVC